MITYFLVSEFLFAAEKKIAIISKIEKMKMKDRATEFYIVCACVCVKEKMRRLKW